MIVRDHIGREILRFEIKTERRGSFFDRWYWEVTATPDDRGRYENARDGITFEVAYGFAFRYATAERRAHRAITRYRRDSARRAAAIRQVVSFPGRPDTTDTGKPDVAGPIPC